jgi:hypothetical protein
MPPGTMVGSWPKLPSGSRSGSMALQQQESFTTKGLWRTYPTSHLGIVRELGLQAWELEKLTPPLASCSTWRASSHMLLLRGEAWEIWPSFPLTLFISTCGRQETWPCGHDDRRAAPCSSPAATLQGAGLEPLLNSTVELSLVDWGTSEPSEPSLRVWVWVGQPCLLSAGKWFEQGRDAFIYPPPTCPLTSMASKKAGSRVMRMEELAMFLTSCNNRENKCCTSPGQQDRVGPDCRDCWWASPEGCRAREPAFWHSDLSDILTSSDLSQPDPGLWTGQPNIYELLECIKGLILQMQSYRIFMIKGNNRMSERSLSEVPGSRE